MLSTFTLPGLELVSIPGSAAQHLPRDRLHSCIHLLLLRGLAKSLHGLLENGGQVLKVHDLEVCIKLHLLGFVQLIPELQQVFLPSFGQPEFEAINIHNALVAKLCEKRGVISAPVNLREKEPTAGQSSTLKREGFLFPKISISKKLDVKETNFCLSTTILVRDQT